MKEQIPPVSFRLQPELKNWLSQRAKSADRSLNAEMNRILRLMKEKEEQEQPSTAAN